MRKALSKVDFKENEETLKQIYSRVACKKDCNKTGFIKCPACNQTILMVPFLKKMNEAIENHVQFHKDEENSLVLKHTIPINVRLALAIQVLQAL